MKSYFCLCVSLYVSNKRLKAGIVEPEETVIARQRLPTSTHALGRCVFSAVPPVLNAECVVKGK
jgi:hypothetical protein